MNTRERTFIYNVLWFACFCWFGWYCFHAATNPANQNAGVGALTTILVIACAPMAVLWCWKRWYTGKWLS